VNFAGGPSRLTEAGPRSGQHCLTVQPSEGAKPCVHVPIRFGGTYELAAWIRCSPGVSARCQAALFDRHGNWLRRYAEVGETNKTEWSRVATQFSVHEPDLGGIDLEFTAHGGDIFVDDASILLVAEEPEVTPDFTDSCDPPSNPPLAKGGKGGWVLLEGGKPTVEPLGPDGSNALRVPAGSGVKAVRTFPAGPGRSYGVRLKFRCEEMASIEVRLPELDEEGQWLRRYAVAGLFSWQEWIEVPCSAQFPADSRAARCCLEVVALGGEAWIDDVRLYSIPIPVP
jgi:hypothetical protein